MKSQHYISMLAATIFAFGATSALAAGGHGAGGMGGAGGLSGSHMGSSAQTNSNGMKSVDRDKGLSRAADRSDTIADRAGKQPGKAHQRGKSHQPKQ